MYEKKTNTKGKQFEAIINKYRRNKMKAEDAHSKLSLMIFVLQYSSVTVLTSEGRSDVHFLTLIHCHGKANGGIKIMFIYLFIYLFIYFYFGFS